MVDSTFIVSPDTPNSRTCSHSPAHILLSNPQPLWPASTNIVSPQQHQHRCYDWQSNPSITEDSLKRIQFLRGRSDPHDELSLNCNVHNEHGASLSSHSCPNPSQTQRLTPLTWLEDEKKWVVGEIYMPNIQDRQSQRDTSLARSPISPISPISPFSPCQDIIQRLDKHLAYNDRLYQENRMSQGPVYGKHRSGTILDDRVARWVAMTQKMHQKKQKRT